MTDQIQTDEILSSNAFRLINHEIDRAVQELRSLDQMARQSARDLADIKETRLVRVRVHEEYSSRDDVQENATLPDIGRTLEIFGYIKQRRDELEAQIRDLQAMKCRLLNDWDLHRWG